MKIAVVTDDEKKISAHFGSAKYFVVLTIEDGKIIEKERREKPERDGHNHHEHGHGHGNHSHHDHAQLAAIITDCEAVLGRGMGEPMYKNLQAVGVRPIITKVADIDQAVLDYAAGTLTNHPERLH